MTDSNGRISPRDVIANTITPWTEEAGRYDFVDKILKQLDKHSYFIMDKAIVHRAVDLLDRAIQLPAEDGVELREAKSGGRKDSD